MARTQRAQPTTANSSVGLCFRRDGDVLIVSISGLYTNELHDKTMRLCAAELQSRPTRAIVLNLRGAVDIICGTPKAVPDDPGHSVAVVASFAASAATERRCAALRMRGHLWVPFTSLEDAMRWAHARLVF